VAYPPLLATSRLSRVIRIDRHQRKRGIFWRAKPLVSYQVIVDLISATTTATGLEVHCELDANTYPKGIVRVNSILPVRTPGRAAAPLFLLTNCRRARPDSTPKIAYTYLP